MCIVGHAPVISMFRQILILFLYVRGEVYQYRCSIVAVATAASTTVSVATAAVAAAAAVEAAAVDAAIEAEEVLRLNAPPRQ